MYKQLDKEGCVRMLADLLHDAFVETSGRTIETTAAVLSVGGGVGLYVYVPQPRRTRVTTSREYYRLGYLRATPPPGKRTVGMDHWRSDVYHGTGDDETSHLLAYYYGEPVSPVELGKMRRAESFEPLMMRDSWFLNALGPVPPAEIFERGVTPLDMKRYPNYLFGPGYPIISATRCRHDYFLTSSCPGCDADEERREGPWTGVIELDYV